MKNIHILPTDKPSRLYNNNGQLNLDSVLTTSNGHTINQNIYITSDEEIKRGDYYIDFRSDGLKIEHFKTKDDWVLVGICGSKKIILTTDQDLINDGVQAINDEFLEWFVKNPSCEEVDVNDWMDTNGNIAFGGNVRYQISSSTYNKIIIPKEEPKQIYYNTVGIENGVNVVKGQFNTQKEALDLANELNRKFPDLYYDWRETLIKEEPKQETLEEAAEKLFSDSYIQRKIFIAGAKWQAERMYSEEEAKTIWKAGQEYWKTSGASITFEELTEQFKKK